MGTHITHIIIAKRFLLVDTFFPLALVFGHPGSTLLTLAGMEIGIEYSQERAILIKHLVSLYIRVINGDILVLLKGDTVQTIG